MPFTGPAKPAHAQQYSYRIDVLRFGEDGEPDKVLVPGERVVAVLGERGSVTTTTLRILVEVAIP